MVWFEQLKGLAVQVLRFAMVGTAATVVHITIVVGLVEGAIVAPTPANMLAFSVAVLVSYFGHYYWTYGASITHRRAYPRFLFVAIAGLLGNYLVFFVMVDTMGIYYGWSLGVVIVLLPAATFVALKLWAFADRGK